jgi:predicted transcriptional regulator
MFDLLRDRDASGITRNEEKPSYNLQSMQSKHHNIARMRFLGYNNKQIAAEVGVSESTVSSVINSPIVQAKLRMMQASADKECLDLQKQIAEIAPKALQNIVEVVETGSLHGEGVTAMTVLKESNNLLDRHMGKATQVLKSSHTHAHLTADDIRELKEAAMAAAAKPVIEVSSNE